MKRIKNRQHNYYELLFAAAKQSDKRKFRRLFLALHLTDQAELFQLLYPENKQKIEQFLTPAEFAEVFEHMDTKEQLEVYEVFTPAFISSLFPYMEEDNVVRFLSHFSQTEVRHLLKATSKEERNKLEEMLAYEPETAGSIMSKGYIVVSPSETVEAASELVRKMAQSTEVVYYLYVLDDENRLVGVTSLRDLLLHPRDVPVSQLMQREFVSVAEGDDQEVAARLIQKYNLLALPVLDEAGRMLGVITVDDLMDVMEEEVTEDFNEFSAISSVKGAEEGVKQATRARMPWIIILIFLGMISTSLISSFEDVLEQVVLLAAFIPIIMDTAGNVGTQALAVAVRKISVGEEESGKTIWRTILEELWIGVMLGAGAGTVLGIVVALFFGHPALGLVIGVSLFITISFSTVVGALIPSLIHKLKIDPAVASGPFITTINDAFGLFVYFTIASHFIHLI